MGLTSVNAMYGADGKLRMSYYDKKASKVARKNAKAFNKQLAKYDKDFINYASYDIDNAKINDRNTRYILGKLNIAGSYIDYLPLSDVSEGIGDEATAIAGNKKAARLGIAAKIASKFQPFFEEQARKHPRLQKLSDSVTKAANNGRMPLTADSAAVMRIAFDKKYYEDSRKPGANVETLKAQHDRAVNNLTKMAMFDGVDKEMLSKKFAAKLIEQMKVDESITDIYSGMATGEIRLAPDEPMLDAKGKEIKVGGKTLRKWSNSFVSPELDKDGKNIGLDAWEFETREPQSIESIVASYKSQFDDIVSKCETEKDLKSVMASPSFANIERNAKAFAEADCPDDADKFRYELSRANIAVCRQWAIDHGYRMPYANMTVPPPYSSVVKDNPFVQGYSVSDYQGIDSLSEKSREDKERLPEDKLSDSLKKDVDKMSDNTDYKSLVERLNKLEAENAELKKRLELQDEQSSEKSSEKSVSSNPDVQKLDGMMDSLSTAMNIVSAIRSSYGVDSNQQASVLTPALQKLLNGGRPDAPNNSEFKPPQYNNEESEKPSELEEKKTEEQTKSKEFKINIDGFDVDIDFKNINGIVIKDVRDTYIVGSGYTQSEENTRIYYDAENDSLKARYTDDYGKSEKDISLEEAAEYIKSKLQSSIDGCDSKDKQVETTVYTENQDGLRTEIDAKAVCKQTSQPEANDEKSSSGTHRFNGANNSGVKLEEYMGEPIGEDENDDDFYLGGT